MRRRWRRAALALCALLAAGEVGGRAYFARHPDRGLAHLEGFEQRAVRARDVLETRPEHRGPLVLFHGASTTEGVPFDPTFSPVKWLELFLADLEPEVDFRLVNFGRGGAASPDLAAAVEHGVKFDPDLVVVTLGNNEFLRRDDRPHPVPAKIVRHVRGTAVGRLVSEGSRWVRDRVRVVRLQQEVERELERRAELLPHARLASASLGPERPDSHGLGDWERDFFQPVDEPRRVPGSPRSAELIAEMRFHLTSMVRSCRTRGVPLLVVSAPRNVRATPRADCLRVSGDELVMWKARVRRGLVHERAGEWEKALGWYDLAEELDDTNARLAFQRAGCLERLGDTSGALVEYERAIHHDLRRARMFDDVEAAIRSVCEELRVPYLDGQAALARHDDDGILGFTSFVDQAHPTLLGQHRLARELARFLYEESDVVRVDPAALPREFEADLARIEVGPDFEYETNRRLGDHHRGDYDAALAYYERAWSLDPTPEICLRALELCRHHGRMQDAIRWVDALEATREE